MVKNSLLHLIKIVIRPRFPHKMEMNKLAHKKKIRNYFHKCTESRNWYRIKIRLYTVCLESCISYEILQFKVHIFGIWDILGENQLVKIGR